LRSIIPCSKYELFTETIVESHKMKRIPLFCLLGALIALFPTLSDGQGARESVKLSKEGTEALKKKDWNRAVDLFRKAADLDRRNVPSLSAALQQRATAYQNQQPPQYLKTIEDFSEALELTPDDPGIYERRAYAEMKLGDYDRALADYNELIKHKPNEARYYLLRSYIYEVKGDAASAIADCDKVLQMQKTNAEAKARKQRMQTLQAQQTAPTGPIAAPSQPAPPKKP
jgi:tetratricopeptide (TPR) repeat protein